MAIVCGALVGLERQLRGKPAGIRTSALVCLGSATFSRLGMDITVDGGDPGRVVGQIIVGVGFLGAGVILARGQSVVGLTSAATIWMLSAVGAVCGLGRWPVGAALTGVVLLILIAIGALEHRIDALRRGVHGDDEGGRE